MTEPQIPDGVVVPKIPDGVVLWTDLPHGIHENFAPRVRMEYTMNDQVWGSSLYLHNNIPRYMWMDTVRVLCRLTFDLAKATDSQDLRDFYWDLYYWGDPPNLTLVT